MELDLTKQADRELIASEIERTFRSVGDGKPITQEYAYELAKKAKTLYSYLEEQLESAYSLADSE